MLDLSPERLLLLVVGAHPLAELADRPTAYALREEIARRQRARGLGMGDARAPLVISDVWYLNDEGLRACPAIAIGGPSVNALSAYLGDRLPSAYVVDDALMVQLDVEFEERLACCWGLGGEQTAAAVRVFCERYLDQYLVAVGA